MRIEGLVKDVVNLAGEAVRMPGQVVEKIGNYTVDMVSEALELVAPTQTQEEFVEALQKERPFSEAECAMRALKAASRARETAMTLAEAGAMLGEDGTQEVVSEKLQDANVLSNIGYAMIKKNIIRAHESEEIPDRTTRELVFQAIEVGADPERKGFLRQEEVQATTEVFNNFDNVTVFPQGK